MEDYVKYICDAEVFCKISAPAIREESRKTKWDIVRGLQKFAINEDNLEIFKMLIDEFPIGPLDRFTLLFEEYSTMEEIIRSDGKNSLEIARLFLESDNLDFIPIKDSVNTAVKHKRYDILEILLPKSYNYFRKTYIKAAENDEEVAAIINSFLKMEADELNIRPIDRMITIEQKPSIFTPCFSLDFDGDAIDNIEDVDNEFDDYYRNMKNITDYENQLRMASVD